MFWKNGRMNNHQGQIIEYVVRKNGFNISELALQLGVNRRTLYNYFSNTSLKSSVILQIGAILRHDFSKEFPEMFAAEDFQQGVKLVPKFTIGDQDSSEDELYKEKYVSLLERYNALLINLVSVA